MQQQAAMSLWRFRTWPRVWKVVGVLVAILAVPLCMAVPLRWVDNPAIAVPVGFVGVTIAVALLLGTLMSAERRRKADRDAVFRSQADLLGMVFEPDGTTRLPGILPQRDGPLTPSPRLLGDFMGLARTIRGRRAGVDVSVHDGDFPHPLGENNDTRTSSFALARAGRDDLPDVVIKPETFLHRIADRVFRKDVRTGHAAFDARFRVLSGDPDRHAEVVALLAPLTSWLVEARSSYRFELFQGTVIVFSRRKIPGERIPELVDLAEGFVRRLPRRPAR